MDMMKFTAVMNSEVDQLIFHCKQELVRFKNSFKNQLVVKNKPNFDLVIGEHVVYSCAKFQMDMMKFTAVMSTEVEAIS